jgi:hypothetical protein
LNDPAANTAKEPANQVPGEAPASPTLLASSTANQRIDPGSLVSAFEVDLEVSAGVDHVLLDGNGHVVSGHLEVFAARSAGRTVRSTTETYDAAGLHAAAVIEHDQCRTVGQAASKLVGPAACLGVEAGRSRTAIARDMQISRSSVSRSAAATALMNQHPDLSLSKSHFEAVLPLAAPEQRRFLEAAQERRLPVRQLEEMIATDHPERRRQRQEEEILAEFMERSGLAERLGDQWKTDRRGCVSSERQFLRLILAKASYL